MDQHLWLIYSDHNCSQCKEQGRGPDCSLRAEQGKGTGLSVTITCFQKKLLAGITHSKYLHWNVLFINLRFCYRGDGRWNYNWLEDQFSNHIALWICKIQKSGIKNPTDHILNKMDKCKFLGRHLFKVASWIHWKATSLQRELMCMLNCLTFLRWAESLPAWWALAPALTPSTPVDTCTETQCSPGVPVSIIISSSWDLPWEIIRHEVNS